jgi:hypothetical protein
MSVGSMQLPTVNLLTPQRILSTYRNKHAAVVEGMVIWFLVPVTEANGQLRNISREMRGTEGWTRDEQCSRQYLWVPVHSIFSITFSVLCNNAVRPFRVP